MGMREQLAGMLEGLLAFGRVVATKQATETKQVLATIAGNGGDGAESEQRPYQALWGHAGIVWRPVADTEVIFVRAGDEMVPIASRELRWSIEIEEGEVVVRNLKGDTPARVRLLASGEVLIEGSKIAGVAPGDALAIATKALALAEKVDQNQTTLQNAHDTHSHATAPNGPVSVPSVIVGPLPSVAGARFFSKD